MGRITLVRSKLFIGDRDSRTFVRRCIRKAEMIADLNFVPSLDELQRMYTLILTLVIRASRVQGGQGSERTNHLSNEFISPLTMICVGYIMSVTEESRVHRIDSKFGSPIIIPHYPRCRLIAMWGDMGAACALQDTIECVGS